MWHGTPEQFYELYSVTAMHLKSVFGDKIKVGGYATCGFRHIFSDPEKYEIDHEKLDDPVDADGRSLNFLTFFEGFFAHIKKNNVPIDFFSWHSYLTTDRTVLAAKYLERRLNELGYGDLETQLNEWNNVTEDRSNPLEIEEQAKREYGKGIAAAKAASMMCAMHKTKTKLLCYYDAGIGVSYYRAMFDPRERAPFPIYYAFAAFNELYRLENEVECIFEEGKGIYALAASGNGENAVLIANTSGQAMPVTINLPDGMSVYVADDTKKLEKAEQNPKSFTIPKECVILIK